MTAPGGRIVFDEPGDVWLFAYGSLMWDPGFDFEEVRTALLRGYHRAFCVHSEIYPGTPERPGLSLGLDRGGACRGLAFRIAEANRDAAAAYLEKRELVEGIYSCRRVRLTSVDGPLDAYPFIVNRGHAIYAPKQPIDDVARIIAGASGGSGTNTAYLANTVTHLDELGIADGTLHELLRRVDSIGEITPCSLSAPRGEEG
jgi:cation transport protein ChaC